MTQLSLYEGCGRRGGKGLTLAQHTSSLRLDPKLFDHRPPFINVGLLQSCERFGRLLFGRKNLLPEIG
jgi:hypothetical protein